MPTDRVFDGLNRRSFLVAGATASAALLAVPVRAATGVEDAEIDVDFPRTAPARAQDFVRLCHFDLDGVRKLLEADASLALAAWDWGFGDWETALGAASHVGRRDIIELLVAHGARPDHFTAAAIDDVDGVRAACSAHPGLHRRGGPHGITLLEHARNGSAVRVIAYLEELGSADERAASLPLTDEETALLVGRYAFELDGGVPLLVERGRRGGIGILREGGTYRPLHRLDARAFSPAGAPHVAVRFGFDPDEAGRRAAGLTIHRGLPILTARRVAD